MLILFNTQRPCCDWTVTDVHDPQKLNREDFLAFRLQRPSSPDVWFLLVHICIRQWIWASTDQTRFHKLLVRPDKQDWTEGVNEWSDPPRPAACGFTVRSCRDTRNRFSVKLNEKLLYVFVTKLTPGNKAGWVLSFRSFNFPFIYSSSKRETESRGHAGAAASRLCKKSIQQRARSCLLFYFLRYEPE